MPGPRRPDRDGREPRVRPRAVVAAAAPSPLPPLPALATIRERLPQIFPEGLTQRGWFVRDIAAKTIFVMLYTGAIHGSGRHLRPNQVTRMSDDQAALDDDAIRLEWRVASLRPHRGEIPGRWYAVDSREPIRDETLRYSYLPVGAVTRLEGLSTTSSRPIWALATDFAELFTCSDDELPGKIAAWRAAHLSRQALARVALAQRGVTATAAGVAETILVTFPNGEARRMASGISSEITKAVVEAFATRFLTEPGVLWISESRNQVVARDEDLARNVGLDIDRQDILPDIILVDLAVPEPPLFVFVEVVATDGPVNEERKRALLDLVRAGGHGEQHAAFVTAYWDRGRSEFRKTVGTVAHDSFVWCATEPDSILAQIDTAGEGIRLTDIIPQIGREE